MDTNSPARIRRRLRMLGVAMASTLVLLPTALAHAEYATPVPPLDTPPRVLVRQSAVRAPARELRRIRVPVVVDEPVRLDVAARGRTGSVRTIHFARRAGATIVEIPVFRPHALVSTFDVGRAALLRIHVVATDASGRRDELTSTIRVLAPRHYVPSTRMLTPLPGFATSSGFGSRWGRLHAGIDIPAPTGTGIVAARRGIVTSVGHDGGYGLTTVIDHGPYTTHYAHQSSVAVRAGQRVERGQVIGAVGRTGSTTGAHLHFEVHVGGGAVDPMRYLA